MKTPIFWNPQFSLLNQGQSEIAELIDFETNSRITVPFVMSATKFRSPGIGTFGGLFSEKEIPDWSQVWLDLLSLNPEISDYEIVFPPEYFMPDIFVNQVMTCVNLFDAQIILESNQHVLLNNFSTDSISKGNRKKFRQFNEASGEILRGENGNLEKVIDVLEISRKNLGVQLSMSRDQIRAAFEKMPDEYSHYSANVVYVLYWGDVGDSWKSTSPVVALCLAIAQDCRKKGYSILDLGTSSVDGIVNDGLKKFKENLGAVSTFKRRVFFQRPINLA